MDGIVANFPAVDLKLILIDGQTHPVDSSTHAFETAAGMAFREGAAQCKPVVLEPIMCVEVSTPESYVGSIVGDFNSRRGIIQKIEMKNTVQNIQCHVPLSRMFSYIND